MTGRRRRIVLPVVLVSLDAVVLGAWMRVLAAASAPAIRPPDTVTLVFVGLGAVTALTLALVRLPRIAPVATVVGAGATMLLLARRLWYSGGGWSDTAWLRRAGNELTAGVGSVSSINAVAVASIFVWWRAAAYVSEPAPPRRVRGVVGRSILGLAAAAMAVWLVGPVELAPYVVAGTALALAALAASRVDESYAASGTGEMGPAWGLVAPTGIAFVIVLGALIGRAVSPDLAGLVGSSLRPLPEVVGRALVLLLTVVMEVVAWLLAPVAKLLSEGLAENAAALARFGDPELMPQPGQTAQYPLWFVNAARFATLALTALAVAWWLARAVRRYTKLDKESVVAGREISLSRATLLEEVADWVAGLRRMAMAARGRLDRGPEGVRRLYRGFLRGMAAQGNPRPMHVTPHEFGPRAISVVPAAGEDVAHLTQAYVAARYGGELPSAEGLAGLERAAARIREAAGE